jgi:prevent-host-death family protein
VHAVKIADLKNNLSRHLERVRRGTEITVMDRDKPIARLVPFIHGDTPARAGADAGAAATAGRIADLTRQGVLSAGDTQAVSHWLADHEPIKLPDGSPSAVALLLDMRRASTR